MADPWERTAGFRLLWAAAILVPLLILAMAAYWSWIAVEQEARGRLTRTVDMLHEHALRSFETQETVLEAVDQRIREMNWPEIARSWRLHEFLRALDQRADPSGGIILVSPGKVIVNGSRAFPGTPIDISDRDYLDAEDHKNGRTHIGEVVVARPSGDIVFSISRARRSAPAEGASMGGWIVSSFKPDYFEDFYRSVAEDSQDVIALVRADGWILARTPALSSLAEHRPGAGFARGRLTQAAQERPDSGIVVERPGDDGIDRMFAYRRVADYPIYVAYGLSLSVLNSAWMREVLAYAVVCLTASGLLLGLTGRIQSSVRREREALASARAEAEARADAERRLRHTQRVEALGQIVGGVAHDFNNIVQAVKAGSARVIRRADEPEEVRRVAALMDASAERGARLTARMLAFARREEAHTTRFDAGTALADVRDLLGETLGSGWRVAVECRSRLPAIVGDQAEFETVMVNLVLNARDAMPGGGLVTIDADIREMREEEVPNSAAPNLAPGRYVVVRVVDTGEGMDEATLSRAGEAFFTTKERGRGTGLGLAMARGFAEHSGGALTIESERGRGTTVTLLLRAEPPAQET